MSTENVILREAKPDDIPPLTELIHQIFVEYDMEFIAEDEIPDLLDFKSYYQKGEPVLVVAEIGQQLVGCAALKFDDQGGAYFSRVYVDQSYRGQRIGFRLMLDLLKRAQAYEPADVYLWTDTRFERAHRFYQRLGFSYTGHIRPLHDINESFEYHYRLEIPLDTLIQNLTS
ncbi:MAG: GNAT family N-acetyltransferase [Bacteroidota bacterium]